MRTKTSKHEHKLGTSYAQIINTSYQKLPFGSGDYPDKLFTEYFTQNMDTTITQHYYKDNTYEDDFRANFLKKSASEGAPNENGCLGKIPSRSVH